MLLSATIIAIGAAVMPRQTAKALDLKTAQAGVPVEVNLNSGKDISRIVSGIVPKKKVISSIKDVLGTYIFGYSPSRSKYYPTTQSVTISQIGTTDSVLIKPFYWSDCEVKAKVDLAKGTMFIPYQAVYQKGTDIRSFTSYTNGKFDWSETAGVNLTMQEDGSFIFDTGWGIMVDGKTSGYMWCKDGGTANPEANVFWKSNGKMYYKAAPTATDTAPKTYYSNIYIKSEASEVTVRGFFGCYEPLKLQLQKDRTAYIAEQELVSKNEKVNNVDTKVTYNIIGGIEVKSNGSMSYKKAFFTDAAAASENKKIYFENWSLFSLAQNRWYGLKEFCRIESNIEFAYPEGLKLKGEGTQASPYQISNADEWNNMAEVSNVEKETFAGKYFKVMNDIDFSGKEITTMKERQFLGVIDGNGKTLKGYEIAVDASNHSLIDTIGETGEVKNLTLTGNITSDFAYTSGLVFSLEGKLTNVTFAGNIKATKGSIGGLVTYARTGAVMTGCVNTGKVESSIGPLGGLIAQNEFGTQIVRCANKGTVKGTAKASPVAGIAGTTGNSFFDHCYNTGKIETDSTCYIVAGIAGNCNAKSDDNHTPLTVKGCYNTSDMMSTGSMGGILGAFLYSSALKGNGVLMDSCYNTGKLNCVKVGTGTNFTYPTGGLIGKATVGKITNSYNAGEITGDNQGYVGGIIGKTEHYTADSTYLTIQNCYNNADVLIGGTGGYAVGGLLGNMGGQVTLENCFNTGNVKGNYRVGGIVGQAENKADNTISKCYNTGDIESMRNCTGGIIGYTFKTKANIGYCWNTGNISTQGKAGGTDVTTNSESGHAIGGIAGVASALIDNCFNAGKVSGASQVGGIIGATVKDSTELAKCFNIGAIEAPADSCGSIVGVRTENNGAIFNSGNKVTDCFYVTDYLTSGTNNKVGTALTLVELTKKDMGAGWISPAADCTPIPEYSKVVPAALVYSAQAVLATGDKYDNVKKDFMLGTPVGVTWTASSDAVKVDGKKGVIHQTEARQKVTLTAKSGDFAKTIDMTIDAGDGVAALVEGIDIVNEEYYTLGGVRIAKPTETDGQVYIVKITFKDGKSKIVKLLNK